MINKLGQIGVDLIDIIRAHNFSYNVFWNLKRIQYYKKEKMDLKVNKSISKLLISAMDRVPFYKDLFSSEGITKKDLGNIDLSLLPETNKTILRKNFPKNIMAEGFEHRAVYNTTSGSTGEPFEFYNDVFAFPHRQASFMLFNTWMGVGPHERHIALKSPGPLSDKEKFRNRIFGKNPISVLDVNRETVNEIVQRINEVKPVYFEGYTASLVNLARYVDELALDLKVKPKAIIATSEDLVGNQRKLLEDVFDSKVYNRYGSKEFSGAVAQECGICEGLHVNTMLCKVEVVDETGKPVAEGKRGKILITDLTNHVMPFIRYDIGDSAIKGPEHNDCDITFPRIIGLMGREGHFIISKNGAKIPFLTISHTLFGIKYTPHVYTYQFEQRKPGQIFLRVVPTSKFTLDIKKGIYSYLEDVLPDFTIEVEVVDDIATTPSGKRPLFIKL